MWGQSNLRPISAAFIAQHPHLRLPVFSFICTTAWSAPSCVSLLRSSCDPFQVTLRSFSFFYTQFLIGVMLLPKQSIIQRSVPDTHFPTFPYPHLSNSFILMSRNIFVQNVAAAAATTALAFKRIKLLPQAAAAAAAAAAANFHSKNASTASGPAAATPPNKPKRKR